MPTSVIYFLKMHNDIVVDTAIAQQQLQCSISVCIGCIQAEYCCAGHPVHRTHSTSKMRMTYTQYCAWTHPVQMPGFQQVKYKMFLKTFLISHGLQINTCFYTHTSQFIKGWWKSSRDNMAKTYLWYIVYFLITILFSAIDLIPNVCSQ